MNTISTTLVVPYLGPFLSFLRGHSRQIKGNTAQMRLRILTDLFRQKFVRKTLKYTKYSCGFPPFSDEKSLARLSCRFVRYCPKYRSLTCIKG